MIDRSCDAAPNDDDEAPASVPFDALAGRAPSFRGALRLAARAAASDAPVLLLGETGTGKELVARAIHAASPRAGGPLVTLDCGALQDGLLEAELFGVTRGAFTGADADRDGLLAAADGGTLFIDEVGELSPQGQTKLLRALAQGEVRAVGSATPRRFDARVIAATHRDLGALADVGTFREDLLFRLAVVVVRLPPLRQRKGDLLLLARRILEDEARASGACPRALTPGAEEALLHHAWPGNVRELRNALRRALAVAAPGDPLGPEDLALGWRERGGRRRPAGRRTSVREAIADAQRSGRGGDDGTVADVERAAVLAALAAEGGNVRRAARRAGLHPATLYRMLHRWGIARR